MGKKVPIEHIQAMMTETLQAASQIMQLGEDHGKGVVDDLVVSALTMVGRIATEALGKDRALELLATQYAAVEIEGGGPSGVSAVGQRRRRRRTA